MRLTHPVLNSSVGKKLVMAASGILLCLFLLFHLLNNLTLFAGPDVFNSLVSGLEKFKPLVRVLELVMALLFISHIGTGLRLTLQNRRAKTQKYSVNASNKNSSLFSRTMGLTGSIIFIFLVTHLATFWYTFQINHDHDSYYNLVTNSRIGFANLLITVLYLVAMIILGSHVKHGFSSVLQTFGIRYSKLGRIIHSVSIVFWFFIPAGFFAIAFWFGILHRG